jgi:hypothetical protein
MDRTELEKIYKKHIYGYLEKDRMARFEDIPTRIFIDAMQEALAISRVSNCDDKHLSNICDKEGHQMSELWYVNEDRIPFQLEHSEKCCICGYENNSI